MAIKLAAGGLGVVLLVLLLQGCLFGGGSQPTASIARPGSIPTATLPPNLPEPILLGEAPATTSTGAIVGGAQTYTVKPGDTLGAIAAALGVPGDQIASWTNEVLRLNGIADARLLAAGVELQLPRIVTPTPARATGTPGASSTGTPAAARTPTPQVVATTASGASSPTPRPTVAATGGGGTYTVQSGDFALAIAEKLGVPASQQLAWADQLVSLNNLNPNAMVVGTVLQLPAGTPGR